VLCTVKTATSLADRSAFRPDLRSAEIAGEQVATRQRRSPSRRVGIGIGIRLTTTANDNIRASFYNCL
jgi:hypothetical protein